ncbi:MAG: hypothetical protein WA324_16185 [Bryobacteraceae bacterium]
MSVEQAAVIGHHVTMIDPGAAWSTIIPLRLRTLSEERSVTR